MSDEKKCIEKEECVEKKSVPKKRKLLWRILLILGIILTGLVLLVWIFAETLCNMFSSPTMIGTIPYGGALPSEQIAPVDDKVRPIKELDAAGNVQTGAGEGLKLSSDGSSK